MLYFQYHLSLSSIWFWSDPKFTTAAFYARKRNLKLKLMITKQGIETKERDLIY